MWLKLYDKIIILSKHKYAVRYLAGMSFIEAIFFPIPPDTMLIPMALARPNKALYFAFITLSFSIVGGVIGYLLGMWALDLLVMPFINDCGLHDKYDIVYNWFTEKGIWAVFIAGFTPIPYKLIAVCSGIFKFNLAIFVLISILARGLRFFALAIGIYFGGAKLEILIRKILGYAGWFIVTLVAIAAGYYLIY